MAEGIHASDVAESGGARRIRTIEQLPSAFDLGKYVALRTAHEATWASVLDARLALQTLLKMRDDPDLVEENESLELSARETATDLLLTPILPPHRGFSDHVWDTPTLRFGPVASFRVSTAYGVVEQWQRLPPEYGVAIAYLDEQRKNAAVRQERTRAEHSALRKAIAISNEPFFLAVKQSRRDQRTPPLRCAVIDMTSTDDLILAAFKEWLTATRQRDDYRVTMKSPSRQTMWKWVDEAIVPYLDLTFWAQAHRVHIDSPVLQRAVLPNHTGSDSKIRKTLPRNARQWLSEDVLSALRAKAAKSAPQKLPAK